MSIVTKTGDKGETSLWSGQRLPKDEIRVECYGTIDELNSHLGDAKHKIKYPEIYAIIENIQYSLFRVAGQLATVGMDFKEPITDKDVEDITSITLSYEAIIELKGFVIPGNTVSSAKLDICRTIARRAERRIIALNRNETVSTFIIQYINRLSDLLYILARYEEKIVNKIKFKDI